MDTYSPNQCLLKLNDIISVEDAINSDMHSIGSIQREESKKFTRGLIIAWLVYLNKMLNLNKSMSEGQIKLAASLICEDFYMLKISDLTLMFRRIISGQYGEFFERLSIDKILTFFRKYREERFEIAINDSERAHINNKQNEKI